MSNYRRKYTAGQKVRILREHQEKLDVTRAHRIKMNREGKAA